MKDFWAILRLQPRLRGTETGSNPLCKGCNGGSKSLVKIFGMSGGILDTFRNM